VDVVALFEMTNLLPKLVNTGCGIHGRKLKSEN